MPGSLINSLRAACDAYVHEPVAIYKRRGTLVWPLTIRDEGDLLSKLQEGGHFLPLPKEPAALANVIEVALANYLMSFLTGSCGATVVRGTERGYPDLEASGEGLGNRCYAIDIKVARRARSGRQTDSRITLYTGNTYFRYPGLKWPGTIRPFDQYTSHIDVIALYTLDESSAARATNLEFIVQEPWRIASHQRSSTTREYIGAVMNIEDLRTGKGEFADAQDFYRYWRAYNFRIGRATQRQLDRLLRQVP